MPRTMRTLAGCPTLDRDPRILNRLSGTQYKCSGGTHLRTAWVGVRWGLAALGFEGGTPP